MSCSQQLTTATGKVLTLADPCRLTHTEISGHQENCTEQLLHTFMQGTESLCHQPLATEHLQHHEVLNAAISFKGV